MNKKIFWNKWVDPIGVHPEEENEFIEENEYFNDFEKYENEKDHGITYKARPAALTSFGIIPINHYNNPNKSFNFWVGHTNFIIGEKVYNIIENTPGVEILDIFSPYRFRISVGLAFSFREVKNSIESGLKAFNEKIDLTTVDIKLNPAIREKIVKRVSDLQKKSKYWLIYVLPNGEFDVVVPPDLLSFNRKKDIFVKTQELGGGLLLSSDVFGV